MDRTILVKVHGHYLVKDNSKAGVQHESNAVTMRIEFDPGWDGFAKKITFWNADGKHPVERTLTADLLEDMTTNTRAYLCPIPGEAMEVAGEMTFIIDGYVDGKRQRSLTGTLKVEPARFIEHADEPSDPTPSQAEQLQVQIDTLLGDMQAAAVRAEQALADALRARDEAVAIIGGTLGPESLLDRKADLVNGKVPLTQLPSHASLHKTGGIDALTAADVGAVNKAGDTMTGVLKLAAGGGNAIFVTNSDGSYIHTCVEENTGNDVLLIMRNIGNHPDLNSVLTLAVQKDGAFKDYQVIHEGNKSLIKPNDIGSVNKAGDVMNGSLHVAIGGGNAVLVSDPACAYLQTFKDNDWERRRTLLVRNQDESPDLSNAVSIAAQDGGAWVEHNLIHTGNLHLLNDLGLVGLRVKTDSYLGNGKYGASDPNSISIGFAPKLVIIQDADMNGGMNWGIWISGSIKFMSYDQKFSCIVPSSGETFKWYSTASAMGQFNNSNVVYNYIAIG